MRNATHALARAKKPKAPVLAFDELISLLFKFCAHEICVSCRLAFIHMLELITLEEAKQFSDSSFTVMNSFSSFSSSQNGRKVDIFLPGGSQWASSEKKLSFPVEFSFHLPSSHLKASSRAGILRFLITFRRHLFKRLIPHSTCIRFARLSARAPFADAHLEAY